MSKEPKLIYIEWCDAVASGNEWTFEDVVQEWGEITEWVVKECGWLISETKEYIVIASCYKEPDEFTDAQFKHLMKIPKPWIIKRKEIKYPEPSWTYPVSGWIRGKELEKEMKKRDYKL